MKRRSFIKSAGALASVTILPSTAWAIAKKGKLRTAHIGVGGMGGADLASISSHPQLKVTALVDVDTNSLVAAGKLHPKAQTFADYRIMFDKLGKDIDAVVVSKQHCQQFFLLGIALTTIEKLSIFLVVYQHLRWFFVIVCDKYVARLCEYLRCLIGKEDGQFARIAESD